MNSRLLEKNELFEPSRGKTNNVVFEQVRHKPGCTATDDSYTEQKKKRNNRPPRIFEFKGKTLIISGLLLYDSHSYDIRVYHVNN